ncbi:MAG TPA: ElyC/SanA/YdcF family protein [Vicinamibacterales bacterium]|nr:ElyC/SanA/YdcF family protein [Vicinamibacterales bacterium]
MTHRHDIICISSIDWAFIWQGHQEIMSRLAAEGHRVLYVENTGVRQLRVSDLGRVRDRIRNWWHSTKGFRQERPNLFVYSPLVLPMPYSRIARWINARLMVRSLTRWMRATGFSRPIVWTFLPTPLVLDVITQIEPVITIYHCVDEFSASSSSARRIVASEEKLFSIADLVFVTSEKLRARAAKYSQRVHLFPSGVNIEAFAQADQVETPADVRSLPRPIAGYVGGLHQWVDQALLAAAAQRLPDASFVLIGPEQVDVSALRRHRNVHLLGQRPHAELAGYIAAFDVTLVPYRIAEYTENVYPAKMNEYLAMGKPVIATDLPEVRRFNEQHGDVVRIAGDADTLAASVRELAAAAPAQTVERRRSVARANSWHRRIADMLDLIDTAVAAREREAIGWEDRLRRLYARARRRSLEAAGAVLAIYLLLFHTPLLWWVAAPLKVSASPVPADAVVVFAGGVGESGKAGVGLQERVSQAISLYKAGYASRIIFSSGYVFTMQEAQLMKAVAVDQGVPPEAIVLEEHAANTYQNVAFTARILNEHQWRRIMLVSSPYHMRRAMMTWRKVAPDVQVVPTPVPQSEFYASAWGASFDQIRGILHEYAAIADYWRKGWL